MARFFISATISRRYALFDTLCVTHLLYCRLFLAVSWKIYRFDFFANKKLLDGRGISYIAMLVAVGMSHIFIYGRDLLFNTSNALENP